MPKSIIVHTHDRSNPEYTKLRGRKNDISYLRNYWNIKDFVILSDIKELLPIIPKLTDIKSNDLISMSESNIILAELTNIFQKMNKEIILTKDSCLQAVVNHRLHNSDLHIIVPTLTSDEIQYLTTKQYFYSESEHIFIKNNQRIYIYHQMPNKTKLVNVEGKYYNIPFPVVPYLKKVYGDNWQEIGRNYGK